MKYDFLPATGALLEASAAPRNDGPQEARPTYDLERLEIPSEVIELVPESVARENCVIPVDFDGETATVVASDVHDIALADKLRFIIAKNVELVHGSREQIQRAIIRHYGETCSVDSLLQEFTETSIDFSDADKFGLDDNVAESQLEDVAASKPKSARVRGQMPRPARSAGESLLTRV